MAVSAKSTGSINETYVLTFDGNIVSLNNYLRQFDAATVPILRIGFSLTRLKKWKRSFDWKEQQNSRPATGR